MGKIALKKSFKVAADMYNHDSTGEGVHPISKIDGDIIIEIASLLKVIGKPAQPILDALSMYKDVDDQTILDSLRQCEESLESAADKGNEKTIDYISLKDRSYAIWALVSFEKQVLPHMGDEEIYAIVLNGDVESAKAPFRNIVISYKKEEECDEDYDRMKTRLKEFTNIRIL